MSEEQNSNGLIEDSKVSRLEVLAVAAEHNASISLSPCKAKLTLPDLTPAMQQDLVLAKGSGGKAGSKPLSIANRPEFVDYPLSGIVTPHPHDVLCGRGGGSNNHLGNESFRELVNEVKVPYVKCAKREKPLIARRIVEAVRLQTPPGRFLIKDTKSGTWNDIGDARAREKTSQALREGAPVIRNMSSGITKPTSPSDLAALVKEAKKAERTEKEYDVTLPSKKRSLGNMVANAYPLHGPNKQNSMVRGISMGNNSPTNNLLTGPDLKKFRPLGEQSVGSSINNDQQQHQPAQAWHHPHMAMPAYAFAPQATPPSSLQGTVPLETVRQLLLGQLDPVHLALQILPPEDAIAVARLVHQPRGMMNGVPPPRVLNNPAPPQPHTSSPVVSDQSTASASSQQGGDDNSSVGSKQSNKGKHRALPKKKRKYVENCTI